MTNSVFTNDMNASPIPPYCDGTAQFYFLSNIQLFSQLEMPGWLGIGTKALKINLPELDPEGMAGDDYAVGKYRYFSVRSQYLDDNPAKFAQILAAIHALAPQQLPASFESELDLNGHIVCVVKDARADVEEGAFYITFNGMDRQDISGALAEVSKALLSQAKSDLVFVDEGEELTDGDLPTALFGEACTLQGNQLLIDIEEYEQIACKDKWHDVKYRLELDRHNFLNALQRVLLRADHQLEQLSKAWASVAKIA
jgi:hypothetical protein